MVPALTSRDGTALLTFATYQAESRSGPQILDAALGVTVNILRTLCGSGWRPEEVLLPRAAPADQALYRHHFRAPVRFNQESASHRLPGPRFGSADRRGRSSAAGHAGGEDPATEGRARFRIVGRHSAVAAHAADEPSLFGRRHRPSADDAPAHPDSSPQRQWHGLPGDHERDPVRDCAAVAGGHRKCRSAQIAAALGYSEASAFTRAFRRWSGQTPTTWRAEGHQG